MPTIPLPYDTDQPLPVRIADRNFLGVAEQPVLPAVPDAAAEIRRALAAPVGSPPLRELARGRRAVTIAVTDITRYCPDDLVLPLVLDELARAGVPEWAVTVVLGVGSQATRAVNSAIMGPQPVLKKDGIVIVPTPCPDGLGGEVYRAWLRDVQDGPSIVEKARTQGIPEDGHKGYQFGRYLCYASEVIVTDCLIPPETIREVRLTAMATVQQALDHALARLGPDASVLVIPHGVVTLPVLP